MKKPKRPRVYVLYTGGTIGMAGRPLKPLSAEAFSKLLSKQPGFTGSTLTVDGEGGKKLVIDYKLDAITPPIDSSSMTPREWVTIAERLLDNYDGYDGLVVLHGTDTMAFTSSALSFLLEGLSKPVVVTGSQVPLSKTRNDALRNLITSMVIAATEELSEVTLCFGDPLLRGNRAMKINASEFPAFASPNFPPLGTAGIQIALDSKLLRPSPPPSRSLARAANRRKLATRLRKLGSAFGDLSTVSLILFPGIEASTVRAQLRHTRPRVGGVILQAFGAGNAPANPPLIAALKRAHDDRGVVLVDVTQVLMGTVDLDAYQSASGLVEAGAVSGYDMTPEAALAKLVYLTGLGLDQKTIERRMKRDLRGELTRAVQQAADRRLEKARRLHGRSRLSKEGARLAAAESDE